LGKNVAPPWGEKQLKDVIKQRSGNDVCSVNKLILNSELPMTIQRREDY
jgi:hypothetical protein